MTIQRPLVLSEGRVREKLDKEALPRQAGGAIFQWSNCGEPSGRGDTALLLGLQGMGRATPTIMPTNVDDYFERLFVGKIPDGKGGRIEYITLKPNRQLKVRVTYQVSQVEDYEVGLTIVYFNYPPYRGTRRLPPLSYLKIGISLNH